MSNEINPEDFDYYSESQMKYPYDIYDELRSKCPVGRSSKHGGFAFAASYEAAKTVFHKFKTFSSAYGNTIPPKPLKLYPVDLDPPASVKIRRVVDRHFTQKAVEEMRPNVEKLVNSLIDSFIEKGHADLANELVRPMLPVTLMPILGIPLEDVPKLTHLNQEQAFKRASDPEAADRAAKLMFEHIMGLIAARREKPGSNDLLNSLIMATFEGSPLGDDDIARTMMLFVSGALETTTNGVLEPLLYLSQYPEEADRLRKGELDWGVAVDEFLRYFTPPTGLARTVTHETELENVKLKAGEFILALNGAANRDPKRFPQADRCLLDRSDNPHLSFGYGAHICPGRHIARMEIEVLLKAVLTRMPDFRVPKDFVPEWFIFTSRSMKRLPVVFTPGSRLTS